MTAAMNIALQGLGRTAQGVRIVAHNIANLDTQGYRSLRYNTGTNSTTSRHSKRPHEGDLDPIGEVPSDVDLATELIELKRFEIGYRADGAVLVVAARLAGELLDLLG